MVFPAERHRVRWRQGGNRERDNKVKELRVQRVLKMFLQNISDEQGEPLTCQLPLLGRHFAGSLDHGHRPEVSVGDSHEEGEETGPGRVGQDGSAGRVHAHDEQRDEDHPEAGEEEQAASGPIVRQRGQDLRRRRSYVSEAVTVHEDNVKVSLSLQCK